MSSSEDSGDDDMSNGVCDTSGDELATVMHELVEEEVGDRVRLVGVDSDADEEPEADERAAQEPGCSQQQAAPRRPNKRQYPDHGKSKRPRSPTGAD